MSMGDIFTDIIADIFGEAVERVVRRISCLGWFILFVLLLAGVIYFAKYLRAQDEAAMAKDVARRTYQR